MVIPYGTVDISDSAQALKLNEKPEMSFVTNTGLYVLDSEFLKRISGNTFIHITDVLQQCIDEGVPVGVYRISEDKWLDMEQLDELEKDEKKIENAPNERIEGWNKDGFRHLWNGWLSARSVYNCKKNIM